MPRPMRYGLLAISLIALMIGLVRALAPQEHGAIVRVPFERVDPDDGASVAVVDDVEESATIKLARVAPAGKRGEPDRLRITEGGTDTLVPLETGATFTVGRRPVSVESIDTWSGVLDDAAGSPLATVSLQRNGAWLVRRYVLRPNTPVRVNDLITLSFVWGENPIAELGETVLEPRWGVVDDGRIHWFRDFVPGTGLTLRDGTRMTLVGHRGAEGGRRRRIEVLKEGPEGSNLLVVDAGTQTGPVWFLTPDSRRIHIRIVSGKSRSARVHMRFPDGAVYQQYVEENQRVALEEREFTFTLHKLREHAVRVEPAQSPFFETTLRIGDARVQVRQGEVVRVNGAMLRYVRCPHYASSVFELEIEDRMGKRDVALYPGETAEVFVEPEPWRLDHAGVLPSERILLRRPDEGKIDPRYPGVLLLVLGVAGVLVARWRRN